MKSLLHTINRNRKLNETVYPQSSNTPILGLSTNQLMKKDKGRRESFLKSSSKDKLKSHSPSSNKGRK